MNKLLKDYIRDNHCFYGEQINIDEKKTTATVTLQVVVSDQIVWNISNIQGFGADTASALESAQDRLLEFLNFCQRQVDKKITINETLSVEVGLAKYTIQMNLHDRATGYLFKAVSLIEKDKEVRVAREKAYNLALELLE